MGAKTMNEKLVDNFTESDFEQIKARQNSMAFEVLQHLHATILADGEPFALSDGRWAKVRQFSDVKNSEEVTCMFDVVFAPTKEILLEGQPTGHLEFQVKKCGWGGSVL